MNKIGRIASFLLIVLIFQTNCGYSQKKDEEKPKLTFKDRFVFGGNISLVVGTVTFIDVSPNMGFYITPVLLTGTGVTYEYFREKRLGYTYSTNLFGYRVFTSYDFLPDLSKVMPIKAHLAIFAHGEFEALNLDRQINENANLVSGRYWLYSPLLGFGLKQPFGRKSSFNITLLFNLNYSKNLPYSNPMIRVGFYF
jgi:hypothetical protein